MARLLRCLAVMATAHGHYQRRRPEQIARHAIVPDVGFAREASAQVQIPRFPPSAHEFQRKTIK